MNREATAIVLMKHWENEIEAVISFDRISAAEEFARQVNELDGELSEFTGNTSDSRALRKTGFQNTYEAEVIIIPKNVLDLPDAIDWLKNEWYYE